MNDPLGLFGDEQENDDPLGLFEEAPKKKKGLWEDAKLGLATSFAGMGNTADTALSTLAGGAAAMFGDKKNAVDIYDNMESRRASRNQWANPNNEEVGTFGKVVGAAGTLPMQMVGMGLSPAETTHTALGAGESSSAAIKAGLVDAAGNAVGVAIPGWKAGSAAVRGLTGAGANIAQELATKKAIQSMMETQKGKETFSPNMDDAIVSGIVGGGLGVGLGRPQAPKAKTPTKGITAAIDAAVEARKAPAEAVDPGARAFEEMVAQSRAGEMSPVSFPKEGDPGAWMANQLEQRGANERASVAQGAIDARQAAMEQAIKQRTALEMQAADRARQGNAPAISPDAAAHLAQLEQARVAKQTADLQNAYQGELDATPHVLPDSGEVIAPQYGAIQGAGRIDENGMPIKADLSMEAANLENPLQRNLWGDELGASQGQKRSLTDAMDSMTREGRTAAIEQTQLGREMKADPALEAAKMKADIAAASGDNLSGFNAKMRNQRGGLLIGNKKVTVESTDTGFVAKVDGTVVGKLDSNITPAQRAQLGETANVDMVKVDDGFKGKGVGKALYDAWTKANDGNVAPSGKTSPAAWKVWKRDNPAAVDSFVKQEAARIEDGAPREQVLSNITDPAVRTRVAGFAKKQGGGVLFDWKKKPAVDQIEKVGAIKKALDAFVPTEMTVEATLEHAKTMPDVQQNVFQRIANNFTKGGLYQAEKTGNPIVKFTVDKVLNADRLTRADTRDYIHDTLAPAMRALSKQEFIEVSQAMNYADLNKVELTPAMMAEHGFNEKQVNLVNQHRRSMDYAIEGINKAREAAGKAPIEKRTAYASMSATGDFQKLVYHINEAGEKSVVGVIGAKTRPGLESLQKRLMAEGYKAEAFGNERYTGSGRERTGSGVTAMMQALEHLADNDPNSKVFLDILADLKQKEAYSFLNAQKHTKAKKGVFGMEGRKAWESDYQNAKDFMDSQLKYAESAIKWGHISEASVDVKALLSGDTNMPNAKKWSESYFQNALGMNPSAIGRSLEKAVGEFYQTTGVGSTIPRNIVGYSRKAVNTILLGMNPAFLMTNVVQPLLSIPGMTSFLKGRGMDLMSTGYDNMAKGGFSALKEHTGGMNALEKAAFDYAKKNHVYGSDLVDTSSLSRKGGEYYVDKAGNFLAANVESGTRKMMYYTFVHMLDANGIKDFGMAQNLTDMAMNNYSPVERPSVFNALGPVGDMAANLSSFKHNELSRLAMFAREIGKDKNAMPFLTQLATTVAAAGIQGSVLYEEADWLYKQITKAMGKPDSLGRVVLDFSQEAAKYTKNDNALSHGAFSYLGIDMSKRLGISDTLPNSLGEAMFPGGSKLVDIGAAGLSAASDPSEMNLKRLAREAAPGLVTGPMDRNWFSEQTPAGELGQNRKTLVGQVIRNDADKMAKNFGFTGIHESVVKQKLYDVSQRNLAYSDLRTSVMKKMNDSLKTNGKVTQQQLDAYLNYEGDPNTIASDLEGMLKAQQIDAVSAARLKALVAKSVPQLRAAERTINTLRGE